MSNGLEGDAFDLDLVVNVTWHVAQSPLHHVTYLGTKFESATSNGLGGDSFTRNVTDGHTYAHTDEQTDQLWYEINIPLFSKEKSGYNYHNSLMDPRCIMHMSGLMTVSCHVIQYMLLYSIYVSILAHL